MVPPSVTVAAGQLTASFPVATQTQGQATITASFNSTSATAQVVVTAPEVESLTARACRPDGFCRGISCLRRRLVYRRQQPNMANGITWSSTNQSGGLRQQHRVCQHHRGHDHGSKTTMTRRSAR